VILQLDYSNSSSSIVGRMIELQQQSGQLLQAVKLTLTSPLEAIRPVISNMQYAGIKRQTL